MSAVHRLRIMGGPHPARMELELDGKPLRGVYAFRIEAAYGPKERCAVSLTMVAELDLDITAELEAQSAEEAPCP